MRWGALPLLALVGCGSDAPSTPDSKDPRCSIGEFGVSAVGVVQGRLVDQAGAPIAGASVDLLVPPFPMNAVHETGTDALTQADGRFEILVQRLGQRTPAVLPDTVSAQLRVVRSSGSMSAMVQPYRVLVRFNACVAGAMQAIVPTTVELTWRDVP